MISVSLGQSGMLTGGVEALTVGSLRDPTLQGTTVDRVPVGWDARRAHHRNAHKSSTNTELFAREQHGVN